jgi:hypothetical protein
MASLRLVTVSACACAAWIITRCTTSEDVEVTTAFNVAVAARRNPAKGAVCADTSAAFDLRSVLKGAVVLRPVFCVLIITDVEVVELAANDFTALFTKELAAEAATWMPLAIAIPLLAIADAEA